MGDLIDRQAAIDAVISLCDDCDSGYCGSCRVNYPGEKDARKVLKDLPSAQTERPKGEWIDNETSYADGVRQTCTCSVCGIRSVRPLGDFCRWCGADMREDTDNKTTVCPMCFDCPDNCPLGADMRKENR